MQGLQKDSKIKERIEKVNGKAIKYKVVEEEYVIADLESEKKQIEARLAEIPTEPTDKELLAWAKENYPVMDYSKEKESLTSRLSEIEAILKEVS